MPSPSTASRGRSRPLTIPIRGTTRQVAVRYRTRPEAAALQWLEPSQTAGGKEPFLFTQSEPNLGRSWVPCQDTPSVRTPYDATIHVPPQLLAVMSAENASEKNASGVYHFRMPQPVPSYLLALAVGDLAFRPLDQRSGVYAEPSVVDRAAYEFADTPKMMAAAEALYGPYRWGRYDVLVLPPSFPYGGMENPRLTFATPTVLAGDRSLVSLVAHELAHSWSGNLVTNATWNDFWLNEGFTNYFESRIMERIYGREYVDMNSYLELDDLRKTIAEMGPTNADTALKANLAGRDPAVATFQIPYNKGSLFLQMLENAVGRATFDAFLRRYFDTHAFQSMTTERFIEYLDANLLADRPDVRKSVQEWVYGTGLPANVPVARSARVEHVDAEIRRFSSGTAAASLDAKNWSTQEWLRFLQALPDDVSRDRLADLDRAYHFTQSGNAAILQQWLVRAIRAGYHDADPAIEHFLTTVGRRLYVRPIYLELAKTPEGLAMARRIYATARPLYHSVTRGAIDKIVNPAT
jgi:leukotriene-A4 hydrolase